MNIFFPIHTFYPSQTGGPCNSVYAITKELSLLGHKIYILTTNIGIEKNKVKLNKFYKNKAGITYYDDSLSYLKWLKLMIYLLKRVDAIHITSVFSPFSVFCFLITVIFFPHKKIILSPRGELSEKALIYNQKKKKYVLKMYKFFRKNIYFHATCEEEKNEVKFIFPDNEVEIISNYLILNPRENIQKKKNFLYLGRIHHKKSIHKIIEGFNKSQYFRNSDFVFNIVGIPEEKGQEYYEGLIDLVNKFKLEHKIHFLGFKEGRDKEIIFAESYFMMMLSENENFGNVVVESLNQGTPVISSKGAPWEILEKENAGYFIENSPEEIAKYIDKCIVLNTQDYNQMCQNAYNLSKNKFDIQNRIVDWEIFYQKVIND